jgi:hypothetical protein
VGVLNVLDTVECGGQVSDIPGMSAHIPSNLAARLTL